MARLGTLAAKYESNSDPGCVSGGEGDLGGRSYGAIQFSSNAGVVDEFVSWLLINNPDIGDRLAQHAVNSEAFVAEWKQIAADDPAGFLDLQLEYGLQVYYRPAVDILSANGVNVADRSEAVQQVTYSRAVQYGARWMPELFQAAASLGGFAGMLDAVSDSYLIIGIYNFLISDGEQAKDQGNGLWRSPFDWCNGSRDVIDGLLNRFRREKDDALAMLEVA